MQVTISAIGKVHQTILVTLLDNVNKYAIGNTNTTSLNKEIINGLIAYPSDCNIPCTATENPMKIYPILAILKEIVQTSIISLLVPLDNANKLDNGFAKISNITVKINVTIAVSIIPYLIQSFILSLSFIP